MNEMEQCLPVASINAQQVKMVVVADDCALPIGKGITGGRGIAGTVLVHKVAGAAAAAGKSLDEVQQLAQQAADSVGSMGVRAATAQRSSM